MHLAVRGRESTSMRLPARLLSLSSQSRLRHGVRLRQTCSCGLAPRCSLHVLLHHALLAARGGGGQQAPRVRTTMRFYELARLGLLKVLGLAVAHRVLSTWCYRGSCPQCGLPKDPSVPGRGRQVHSTELPGQAVREGRGASLHTSG